MASNRRLVSATAGIVSLLIVFACATAWAAEPKRVLLLHSFGRDFRPWSEMPKRSARNWIATHNGRWTSVSIRSKLPAPVMKIRKALSLNTCAPSLSNSGLDLIVSIGAPAAAFVQRHRQQLFPTTPMLLTVVDQRRVQYSVLTANDAVAPVSINYFGAVENILQVLPNTKNVAIVVGSSPIEKFWREEIGKEVQPFTNRISFTWYNHLSFEEILNNAAALPPQSAIFWELMIVDAAGVVHEEGKALARLMPSPTRQFSVIPMPSSAVTLLAVLMSQCSNTANRWPRSLFASLTARRRAISRCRLSDLEPPSSTGGKCSAGESARAACRREARFTFANRPYGSDIVRNSGDLRCASGADRVDRLADLRASTSPRCGGHGAQFHGRADSYESRRDSGELSASIAHEINQPLTGMAQGPAQPDAGSQRTGRISTRREMRWIKLRLLVTAQATSSQTSSDVQKGHARKSWVDINEVNWTVLGLVYIDLRKTD